MASSIRPSCLVHHRAKKDVAQAPMEIVLRKAVARPANRRAMVNRRAVEIVNRMPGRAVLAKASRRVMVIANRKRIVRATGNVVPISLKKVAHRVAMEKATSRATKISKDRRRNNCRSCGVPPQD